MSDLCSLDDLKSWLGITNTDEDDSLSRLITATSQQIMDEMRRPDLTPSSSYTDRLVGNGTSEIYLRHYPINSISTVNINGVDQDESTDGISSGWFFDESEAPENRQKVILIGSCFPQPCSGIYRFANVVIEYDAGYDDIPADISQAVIEWIGWKRGYSQLQGQNQTQASWFQLGQWQQASTPGKSTLDASGLIMPESVRVVVERYGRTTI